MPTMLNRRSFEKLIAEDLEWLRKQPRSLERMHIETVLERAADAFYSRPTGDEAVVERWWREMREEQAARFDPPSSPVVG